MRTIALAEGMDPNNRPSMLFSAICLRRAETAQLERDRATTLFNMACFSLVRGKDMSYWDVAGHLYPRKYVKEQREKIKLDRMRAEQMQILAMFKQRQALAEEQRKLRGNHHAQ